ncbi:MAG: DMP19 family protein [Treponema sp.]|nr:DMP19 family protein [Treponema sp.]
MVFGNKIERIITNRTEEDAIVAIYKLLSPLFYKNFKKLTMCEKNFIYIQMLEYEVNSGGFDQYFYDNAGNFTRETLNALKTVGSKIILNILNNSTKIFPNGIVPIDRAERQDILLEINNNVELWDEIYNNEFRKHEENIHKLLIDYIKDNINEFR